MKVIHYIRKPLHGYYSFERVFRDVRAGMPEDIEVKVVHAWCHSRGFFSRALNCLQVLFLRADVVHVTGDINYVVPFLIGRKSVLTVHDLAPLRVKSGWRRWLFRKLWYDWPLKYADAVTTVSSATRRDLSSQADYPDECIQVIPNGVDPAFKPMPRDWPSRPTVLIVGAKPQKNLERMFQALQGISVEVLIVGQLDEPQRRLAAQLDLKFRESGYIAQDELVLSYQQADILAFASTYEGFGLPVVEAQATGRPVLTSDIESLREIAGEGGACLVDPLQVASIREGFEKILSDDTYRQSLIRVGFENVKRFQVETVAGQYAEVYCSLKNNPHL